MKFLKELRHTADCCASKVLWKHEQQKRKCSKVISMFSRYFSIMAVGYVCIAASTLIVMAEGTVADASTLMGSILGMILAIFRYVGIALIVWGVIQFVLATKRTDAESKSDAIQTIMCGIVLTALKTIFSSFNLGVSISDITL